MDSERNATAQHGTSHEVRFLDEQAIDFRRVCKELLEVPVARRGAFIISDEELLDAISTDSSKPGLLML